MLAAQRSAAAIISVRDPGRINLKLPALFLSQSGDTVVSATMSRLLNSKQRARFYYFIFLDLFFPFFVAFSGFLPSSMTSLEESLGSLLMSSEG